VALLLYSCLFTVRSLNETHQLTALVLWFSIEVFVVSTSVAVLSRLVAPLTMMRDLRLAKERLRRSLAKAFCCTTDRYDPFELRLEEWSATSSFDAMRRVSPCVPFNASQYLFVSRRVSEEFPELIECDILQQFRSVIPNGFDEASFKQQQQQQLSSDICADSSSSPVVMRLAAIAQGVVIWFVYVLSSTPASVQHYLSSLLTWLLLGAFSGQEHEVNVAVLAAVILVFYGSLMMCCYMVYKASIVSGEPVKVNPSMRH